MGEIFFPGDTAESADPEPPSLGDLIRDGRRDKGLTQGELARGICTRPYISQIEKGIRFPAPVIMKHLADRLGLPLQHFAPSYVSSPMAGIDQCLGLAKIQAKDGSTEEARRTYGAARELHRRRGCPAADGPALEETLGIILLYEGRFEQCVPILREALAHRAGIGKPSGSLAEVCTALGVAYSRQGMLKKASDVFQKAFNIVFAMGTSGNPGHTAWIRDLQYEIVEWLMRVFALQRQFHTARTIFEWATNTWGTGAAVRLPPGIVVLKAIADLGTGSPDAAEASLRHLLDSGACANRPRLAAAVHNNLAVSYRLKRSWARARYHASMALDILRSHSGRIPGHHAGTNELAYAALAAGDTMGAREALDLFREPPLAGPQIADPVLTGESLLLEARLALAEDDPKTARQFLHQAADACEGVRWLEMLIYVEKLQAAFDAGAGEDEKQALLDSLRTSIENWAV